MPLENETNNNEALEMKIAELELKAKIKQVEDKKRQEAMKTAPKTVKALRMDYDSWYALRSGGIPKHHMKEIIWADFTGRGLSEQEECSAYDEALGKYGVKLSK